YLLRINWRRSRLHQSTSVHIGPARRLLHAHGTEPAVVDAPPGAVRLHLHEHRIDETDEIRLVTRHADAVRLRREGRSDHTGEWILTGEPGQNHVVRADRVHLTHLEKDQTVGELRRLDEDRLGVGGGDVAGAGGAARRTDTPSR